VKSNGRPIQQSLRAADSGLGVLACLGRECATVNAIPPAALGNRSTGSIVARSPRVRAAASAGIVLNLPWSIAGLLVAACVGVEPPLFCSGTAGFRLI